MTDYTIMCPLCRCTVGVTMGGVIAAHGWSGKKPRKGAKCLASGKSPECQMALIPVDVFQEYHKRVGQLLDHLSMLDPNGKSERHPDWPLQLRGDEDVVVAFCQNLNGLGNIHESVKFVKSVSVH